MIPTETKLAMPVSQKQSKQKARGRGATKLISVADRKLDEQGELLAENLMQKALNGDASCARFLLSLSEKADVQERCEPKQVKSVAGRLKAELGGDRQADESEAKMRYGGESPKAEVWGPTAAAEITNP